MTSEVQSISKKPRHLQADVVVFERSTDMAIATVESQMMGGIR